jgi:hypothetical protein
MLVSGLISFGTQASFACCESLHKSAALANKSSGLIRGQTVPLNLDIQSFCAPAVPQMLDDINGVDAVIGLNYLITFSFFLFSLFLSFFLLLSSSRNINVLSQELAVSNPMPQGAPLIALRQPALSEYSGEHVEVVSRARLAKLVAHDECHAFIGYVKELNPGANGKSTTSATAQPAEYVAYESELLREFTNVIWDEVPPGFSPERILPDVRKIEHQIRLKFSPKPDA